MTPALEMAAVSDRGQVRAHNEDRVAAFPQLGLALLADGRGGHKAGAVASGMAVDLMGEAMRAALLSGEPLTAEGARSLIAGHIVRANAQIHAAGDSRREYGGMGTTLVVALWHGAWVSVGHVGDSRFYRLRDGALTRLTRDHTLIQEQVDRGMLSAGDARTAAGRNILTRALGTEPNVDADVDTFESAAADVYVLCSDGLTEMLEDEEIAGVLAAPGVHLGSAAAELVRRANDNGGVDNVSVILVRASAASQRDGEGAES